MKCEETKAWVGNIRKGGKFRWTDYADEESSIGIVKAFKRISLSKSKSTER